MSQFLINPYRFAAAGGLGMYQELGRTTLSSPSDTITVSGYSAKPYMMLMPYVWSDSGSQIYGLGTFNSDSSSNYANRWSTNGGTDSTETNATSMRTYFIGSTQAGEFGVGTWMNYQDEEKQLIIDGIGSGVTGAASAPRRRECYCKWDNTSATATTFTYSNGGAGTFDTGSEVIIAGYDPADTEGVSMWEELASVDASSTDIIDTGTMSTTKNYLMVECFVEHSGSANVRWRFNGDSTSGNYTDRECYNMGTDATQASVNNIDTYSWVTDASTYVVGFITNRSDNEKLSVFHMSSPSTAGASTATNYGEIVGKWTTTGSQIDQISVNNTSTGDYANGYLRVWGMD
jgi:hypothetical protein